MGVRTAETMTDFAHESAAVAATRGSARVDAGRRRRAVSSREHQRSTVISRSSADRSTPGPPARATRDALATRCATRSPARSRSCAARRRLQSRGWWRQPLDLAGPPRIARPDLQHAGRSGSRVADAGEGGADGDRPGERGAARRRRLPPDHLGDARPVAKFWSGSHSRCSDTIKRDAPGPGLRVAAPRRAADRRRLRRSTCAPVDVDETPAPDEAADDYVLRLARDKAAALAPAARGRDAGMRARPPTRSWWPTAGILGKPARRRRRAGDADACCPGATHEVHTAVVVRAAGGGSRGGRDAREYASSALSEPRSPGIVATGEADDKAGAYAIQGRASRFIDRIEGSWSNVVGLPVATVYRHAGRTRRDPCSSILTVIF